MKNFLWLSFFFLLIACSKPLPKFENLDLENWRNDKHGCKGVRLKSQGALNAQKEKLLALDETKIMKLLGRPDENELYKRNQKFYRYYLQGSARCNDSVSSPLKLILRFNAMGLCKEVSIEP